MMKVKPGEASPRVALIQILLNRAGASLTVDGIFGPKTRGVVHAFQAARGLMYEKDTVGPDTWSQLPTGKNMKVIDVVDMGDPKVGNSALKDFRGAGGEPIQLGLMCGGVDQMIQSVISKSSGHAKIALLRITGHGNLGYWMTVSVGSVADLRTEDKKEYATRASEFHSYIDFKHIDQLIPVLRPLRGYFAPYGTMEHTGCSIGSRAETRRLMHRLADLWNVPVSAGIGLQESNLNFDGAIYTAFPHNVTLKKWASRFNGMCI